MSTVFRLDTLRTRAVLSTVMSMARRICSSSSAVDFSSSVTSVPMILSID